ncbi:DUF4956 domain-containing protein [Paratractidigestivibacter sp.]|uniref:DUF4956 domain-containing protein n=1 Tax=Paratractidigestivibacter sp. TaxID=2847316 RepID=UPI002ABD6E8D|nr:DUF4956 domain-containing protein [Paratractidigestivibacter sp.]
MLSSVFENLQTDAPDLGTLAACVVTALVLGLALAAIFCARGRASRSLASTIAVLPAMVCVVIALVNGNVGAGVAVAGAFSLVRFRSVPGSASDMGFVFLAMCVGLACGMGYLGVAGLTTVLVGGAYLALSFVGAPRGESSRRTLRITVPEDLDYTALFDDVFGEYANTSRLTCVKTANMGSLYKLRYELEMAPGASEREFIDALRCRNGNLEVSLSYGEEAGNEL